VLVEAVREAVHGGIQAICGYAGCTVGIDADVVRKYVKYQEKQERIEEQLTMSS